MQKEVDRTSEGMKKSAGILAWRKANDGIEVFLVHPGGPYWKNKDEHAWSVPKGEFNENENPKDAAVREFREETGFIAGGKLVELMPVKQPGGKYIYLWITEADFNPLDIKSNTFSIEWPPRSGNRIEVPEVDKAEWFPLDIARQKIHKGQIPFLDQLIAKISG